jgi:hypothetical protein
MNQPNLPLHPTQVHPLTGKPIRALWQRPDGRLMWPVMGGAEDDDAAKAAAEAKAAADAKAASDAKAAADAAAAEAAKKAAEGADTGFPKDTPVAEMKPAEQAAYWKHQARRHEDRATEWTKLGKTPAEVQQELEKLRQQTMTDQEKAVTEATQKGKAEGKTEASLKAARMAFEFALGHEPETNDQSDLIDTLDLSKVVTEDGEIDTAKVRSIASKLAPAGKGTGSGFDIGAGRRQAATGSGVSAGQQMFESRRKKTTTTES